MSDELLRPFGTSVPAPTPSPASARFWEGCAEGVLRHLVCDGCDEILMPPNTHICWRCLSRKLSWKTSSGRGSIVSWTVVWRAPSSGFHVPYAPAVVEFEEGWRHMTAVIGCVPADLVVGLEVAVEFHPIADGASLPYVRPIGAEPGDTMMLE